MEGNAAPVADGLIIDTEVRCLLLPDHREYAAGLLAARIRSPGETWLSAYDLTDQPLIDGLIAAHRNKVPVHVYADRRQSATPKQRKAVDQLVDAGVEITIGTSDAGGKYIAHTKGLVVQDDFEPTGPWCWSGSANFSDPALSQVNDVFVFHSQPWAAAFIGRFERLRAYAWTVERRWQVMPSEPDFGLRAGL
jgi:phosphatidylserine/phosphatidylglycerophosphate/cardiolipin synthase-like enzyme